jgi:hypothetical protein
LNKLFILIDQWGAGYADLDFTLGEKPINVSAPVGLPRHAHVAYWYVLHTNWWSSASAFCRTGVSKPSVNQP